MVKINKILFIDDDAICSFLNIALAEELSIADELLPFANAAEALQYMQQHYTHNAGLAPAAPDLIFLDVKMPGLDGFDFLEELEKLPGLNRSRFSIIMLTASMDIRDHQRAAFFGDKVFAFLEKPLQEEHIKKLLADIDILSSPKANVK